MECINFKYTAFCLQTETVFFFPDELKSCLKLSLLHQRPTQKAEREILNLVNTVSESRPYGTLVINYIGARLNLTNGS